jgi:sulfite reductase (NADPH) hemoprotein beta-component
LPRKFKIAVTGARKDRAASQVHDIGLHLIHNEAGEIGFEVLVGGGLGRTPMIAQVIREFLPKRHLLSYLEAILRVYNQYGRRDNLYKARIKILVNALGADEFRRQVEEEWEQIRDSALLLEQAEIDRIKTFFTPHCYDNTADQDSSFAQQQDKHKAFATWVKRNTYAHKQPGYRIVIVSLKAHGEAPGDITHTQMDAVADLAERYSFDQIRVAHDQNLVLADVAQKDLYPLWQALRKLQLATPNIGTLTDIICCPGWEYCSLANAASIPIAKQIHARFDDLDYLYDLGDIRINMSGCMNACGHHHVGHIGILGVEKNGAEWYQITLGGSSTDEVSLGQRLGPAVAKQDVADTIARILEIYVAQRQQDERFLDTVRRIGITPFKEHVYGRHH